MLTSSTSSSRLETPFHLTVLSEFLVGLENNQETASSQFGFVHQFLV